MNDAFNNHENKGRSFVLVTPYEGSLIEEGLKLIQDSRAEKHNKAALVWEAFRKAYELADSFEQTGIDDVLFRKWADDVNEAIREHLNHETLGSFVEIVIDAGASAAQAARATVRHSENHAMKKEVFDWLDVNMVNHSSMDDAAEAIAGKVVPVKWRTARDWVSQWKAVRSAGTP